MPEALAADLLTASALNRKWLVWLEIGDLVYPF